MPTNFTRAQLARLFALAALLVAVVVIALTLFRSGTAYTVDLRLYDAGQLVKGNEVQIAGRGVGSVKDISLTSNGLADVEIEIGEDQYQPLREGTHARIRQAGLSSVAGRYIEITPGPSTGDEIPDGGMLDLSETQGIVDLDQVLNELDPDVRAQLQRVLQNGAEAFDGVARQANDAFRYLNPALSQTAALSRELVRDQAAFSRLIDATAAVGTTLAERRAEVEEGIANTATTLAAVASEREALEDSLRRAPPLLREAGDSLRAIRTVARLGLPARDLRRVAPRLTELIQRFVPTARRLEPVVRDVRGVLPELREGLAGVPALERDSVPALQSTTSTLRDAMPVFEGLRPYAPDLISGLFNGFGGATAGHYDANGHFARIFLEASPLVGTPLTGLFPPGIPGLSGLRTGLHSRCPGSAAEPHPDGSNPWVPDASLCDPEQNKR